jgi:TRAP-type C4-dicarboxylate transport system permease small subunit
MLKILQFLDDNFERYIGVALLAFVVVLIFIGVLLRLGFNAGIQWQEEITRIFYVLIIYLGASFGVKSNEHIRVTFLQEMLSDRWKRTLDIGIDLIWIAFNSVIFIISLQYLQTMSKFPAKTPALSIDLRWVFGIIPFTFALTNVRLIQLFIQKNFLAKKSRSPDS